MAKVAGVDGCRGGWVVVISDGWPPSSLLKVEVCGNFREVLDVTFDCEAVAMDIPIGLPASKLGPTGIMGRPSNEADPECHFDQRLGKSSAPWPRLCDLMARELLGGKGKSRLFLAPPRETLSAENPVKFQALHLSTTGVHASLPVWGILPRIREVDACMTPSLQDRVFEYYPELVWMDLSETIEPWAHLSSQRPQGSCSLKGSYPLRGEQFRLPVPFLFTAMGRRVSVTEVPPFLLKEIFPSKHTREGIEARLRVLRRSGLSIDTDRLTIWQKRLTGWSKIIRAHVKLDDLLDALGGLKAAADFLGHPLNFGKRLPPLEPVGGRGPCSDPKTFFSTPKIVGNGGDTVAFPCSSRIPRLPPNNPPLDSKGLRMEIWY